MNSFEQQSSSLVPFNHADSIIIGLDYGTTSTGVCIIICSDGKEKNASSHGQEMTERSSEAASSGSPYRSLYRAGDKQPTDVISDYLHHVLNYVGRDLKPEINSLLIHLQFTFPASWSRQAKGLIEAAVNQAWKFRRPQDELSSMSEPEAAAESVHHMLKGTLNRGDTILVCDCGGGTVDIATYNVDHYAEFDLSMIQSIQGAKCGGAAIDCRLFDLMKQQLSTSAFEGLNHLIAPRSPFMMEFKKVKMSFGSHFAHGLFHLPLPLRRGRATCNFDPEGDIFTLKRQDVQSLFDPVVRKIATLIKSQIKEAASKKPGSMINADLCCLPTLKPTFVVFLSCLRNDHIRAVCDGAAQAVKRAHAAQREMAPLQFRIKWVIRKGAEFQFGEVLSHEFSALYYDGNPKEMVIPIYSCRELYESFHGPGKQTDLSIDGNIPFSLAFSDLSQAPCQLDANNRLVYEINFTVRFSFAINRALNFRVYVFEQQIGLWSIPISKAN
ncbi:actin-like ATPase domain-containing protein [Penicillium malachiteum]|uniref:actin-like ATPase domain-containing protein n=1 Tax=Penicillium malachiteum TaxID=1324776 RepID=UPI002547B012|nr:actin-like ATPase domain-containing protein [Penicillium malachiteum]KAJ5715243.1 actin-like ATPase domain-containing protein [Penicillium malachiteum]